MNLVKCSNGHYYDGDKFSECPHCAGSNTGSDVELGEVGASYEDNTTVAIYTPEDTDTTEPLTDTVPDGSGGKGVALDSYEKTVAFYSTKEGTDPVVGWLVCVEGSNYGKSFNLKAGKNFVGRNAYVNDIVLGSDSSVSREKHAIVIYDPKSRRFLVQPGMSSELFYVNDDVVLQAAEIKSRDILSVGNTRLMFMPFCGTDFTWDDYKED